MIVTPDGRRIFEHRYIIEKHIGRPVRVGENVHHINHNGLDNRIENLQLLKAGEHTTLHQVERWSKPRKWAHRLNLDNCIICKTNKLKHASRGRCKNCAERERKHFTLSQKSQR